MSWDRGESPPQRSRRRSGPAVAVGCVLAIVALGLAARQATPPGDLTVEAISPRPPTPTPSPSPRPSRSPRPRPSPGEVVRAQLGPQLPGSGLTLSTVTARGRLLQLDLDTGDLVEVSALDVALDQAQLLPDGAGGLVLIGHQYSSPPSGRAWHIAAADQPPREFAAAEQVRASGVPGRVWLVDDGARAREVAADGTTTAEVELAPGVYPVAAMEGGLLVDAAGTLVLLDPGSGRGTRVGDGRLVTADAGYLARWVCDETLDCWLAVGPADDPNAARVTVAPQLRPFQQGGAALSPDGRWLAAVLFEPLAEDPRVEGPAVVLLEVATGEVRRPPEGFVTGASQQLGPQAPFVWDPSARWLFAADAQGVRVWDVEENSVAAIDVDRPATAFAVQ